MIYKNLERKTINTDKEEVICPWCLNPISKEDIDCGNISRNGDFDLKNESKWLELLHKKCSERIAVHNQFG